MRFVRVGRRLGDCRLWGTLVRLRLALLKGGAVAALSAMRSMCVGRRLGVVCSAGRSLGFASRCPRRQRRSRLASGARLPAPPLLKPRNGCLLAKSPLLNSRTRALLLLSRCLSTFPQVGGMRRTFFLRRSAWRGSVLCPESFTSGQICQNGPVSWFENAITSFFAIGHPFRLWKDVLFR